MRSVFSSTHRKRFHEYSPGPRSSQAAASGPQEAICEVGADSLGSTNLNVVAAQSCQFSFAETSTSSSWPADMSLPFTTGSPLDTSGFFFHLRLDRKLQVRNIRVTISCGLDK